MPPFKITTVMRTRVSGTPLRPAILKKQAYQKLFFASEVIFFG